MVEVRIVSYNVLSDALCDPGHYAFKGRDPKDLDPDTRYKRVGECEYLAARAARARGAVSHTHRQWKS